MDITEYDWDIEVDVDEHEDETTRVLEWRQYRWLALGYSSPALPCSRALRSTSTTSNG